MMVRCVQPLGVAVAVCAMHPSIFLGMGFFMTLFDGSDCNVILVTGLCGSSLTCRGGSKTHVKCVLSFMSHVLSLSSMESVVACSFNVASRSGSSVLSGGLVLLSVVRLTNCMVVALCLLGKFGLHNYM